MEAFGPVNRTRAPKSPVIRAMRRLLRASDRAVEAGKKLAAAREAFDKACKAPTITVVCAEAEAEDGNHEESLQGNNMKLFVAQSSEDDSVWLVSGKDEDEARKRLGGAVCSDGDEFAIVEAKLEKGKFVKKISLLK